MVTNYPATIDSQITLPLLANLRAPVDADSINRLRNAIVAIETELGVKPSGTFTTVVGRLNALQQTINNLHTISLAHDLGGTLVNPQVVGLQGRPISSALPDLGQVLTWNGTAWVPLTPQLRPGYVVTLFGVPNFVEVGQALVNPIFQATYNTTPVTAVIRDSVGNTPQNVFTAPPPSVPPQIFAYDNSYEFSTYPATPFSVTFTLTSSNGAVFANAGTTVTWAQRIYYGVGSPGGNTAAFIQGLSNNPIVTTKTTSFTVNAGAGQAIYFAYRTAYGLADFWVEGFEGGFNLISTTIAVTNAHGFTENYTLYQSAQVNLGITTVNVF